MNQTIQKNETQASQSSEQSQVAQAALAVTQAPQKAVQATSAPISSAPLSSNVTAASASFVAPQKASQAPAAPSAAAANYTAAKQQQQKQLKLPAVIDKAQQANAKAAAPQKAAPQKAEAKQEKAEAKQEKKAAPQAPKTKKPNFGRTQTTGYKPLPQQIRKEKSEEAESSTLAWKFLEDSAANEMFENALNELRKNIDEAFSASEEQANVLQDQFFEAFDESAEQAQQAIAKASEALESLMDENEETLQAITESGDLAADISRDISQELNDQSNKLLSEQTRAFENFMKCRSASDIWNLQNELIRKSCDQLFNNSLRMAELFSEYTRVLDPIQEQFAGAMDRAAKKASK